MEAAQPGNPAGESSLLRCLSLLNDDVLTGYLVPKLVEQGSAGAVALTCSQLRRLCQRSIRHLDLSKLPHADNPCRAAKLARQLAAAFPTCTSLTFEVDSSSLISVHRSITPLLAGLPHLNTISITLVDEGDLDPVLAKLHMHATNLHSLSLQLHMSWVDETDTAWASLGKLTNLTKLQLTFDWQVTDPCSHTNLQPLTGLTNLQSLIIDAPRATADPDDVEDAASLRLAVQQFPGQMTSLTKLWLPLNAVHDISSVSGCVGLRDLRLMARSRTLAHTWRSPEWAAVVQLTSLTCLDVALDLEDADEDQT